MCHWRRARWNHRRPDRERYDVQRLKQHDELVPRGTRLIVCSGDNHDDGLTRLRPSNHRARVLLVHVNIAGTYRHDRAVIEKDRVSTDVVAPRGGSCRHGDGISDLQGRQCRPRGSGDEDVIGGHPHRIRGLRYQLEFSCRVDSGGTGGGTGGGTVWTGGGLVVGLCRTVVGLVVPLT